MKAILFDLDGTLLNTLEDLTDAVNVALTQFGCPERPIDQIRSFVGNGADRLIRRALPGTAEDPDPEQVLACFRAYYADHSQVKTQPYEGIREAVAAVRKEFPVAIVSNKPDQAVKLLCSQYFPGVFALGESSERPRKPAPDMLFAAMEAIGADSCVYVGDSEVDVQTARNAGVPCLSVLWGFRDKPALISAGATCFCETPGDILKTLKEMI